MRLSDPVAHPLQTRRYCRAHLQIFCNYGMFGILITYSWHNPCLKRPRTRQKNMKNRHQVVVGRRPINCVSH